MCSLLSRKITGISVYFCGMFIKPFFKYNKSTKERYTVYKLCESYRKNGGTYHHIIVGFGKLDELESVEEKKLLASRVEALIKNGGMTLPHTAADEKIETLAHRFYNEICSKKRYDVGRGEEDIEIVKMSTLKNRDAREIGAEWMCRQAFNQLGIADFLRGKSWSEEKISLATTHIISRVVYPASELKTVSWIKENSAICEVTGYDKEKITKDLLYGISHQLFRVKDPLAEYLSKRTNELFDLEDKIILYDLTNTYYEGRMAKSRIAKFGRSKEKRNDAKIVVLAVVVNREGFLKYSSIFEGNMADCKTLEKMIDTLSAQTSVTARKPIVVMDAGIATNENIQLLKSKGYDYLCVSRSRIKNYHADIHSTPVRITDKRQQPIELLKVKVDSDNDHYLWVKSYAKEQKERSMNGLLSQRFEEGIQSINYGINTISGTKKLEKVYERIGRLKQKYTSIHPHYDIAVSDNGQGTATGINCKQKPLSNANSDAGIYFLRTSLNEKDEHAIWTIYNVIREIEYTFRVLKTDLNLRPVYHKTDDASMAHLHLGMLAYWIVATVRYQLKQQGAHSDWREIIRVMNTQKCVTTSIENIQDEIISVRQCTDPNEKVRAIYDLLKYKYAPFTRKKSVVPPAKLIRNDQTHYQVVVDT